MYMENSPAPKQAIMNCKNSLRKNKLPMIEPSVNIIRIMHKAPPMIVKSKRVWKAKIVRPKTMAAVRPTASRTIFGL